MIGQERWRKAVAEEMHFTGMGTEFGMRGHRGLELPGEIVGANGLKVLSDLGRKAGFDQCEPATCVPHNVGVGDSDRAIDRKVLADEACLGIGERLGSHPAISVGLRASVFELGAVEHAVAEEPMARSAALRVRSVPDIAPAQAGRNLARHGQVECGEFARDGGKITCQMLGDRRGCLTLCSPGRGAAFRVVI